MPKSAQELLIHAGLHTMILPKAPGCDQAIGRILLQTGTENSGMYQEAVAGSLAKELNVSQRRRAPINKSCI